MCANIGGYMAFWISILGMLIAFTTLLITLFLHYGNKIDRNSEKLEKMIHDNQTNTFNLILSIQQDIRDFHGRLCAIEEKNKQKQ